LEYSTNHWLSLTFGVNWNCAVSHQTSLTIFISAVDNADQFSFWRAV